MDIFGLMYPTRDYYCCPYTNAYQWTTTRLIL